MSLQDELEKRLKVRFNMDASPEYRLTWKHWPIGSRRQICALRASDRRISDSAYSGWRTPTSGDAIRGVENNPKLRNPKAGTASLNNEAALVGWPTPNTVTGGANSNRENRMDTGGPDLQEVAKLAGWPTLALGTDSTCFHSETEKPGALRPGHSRWLMGYPVEWCQAAIRALRRLKQARRKGSHD